MSTPAFALCVLLAVALFWMGLRFIVFRKYVIELFIGIMAILLSIHIILILCFLWPPQ